MKKNDKNLEKVFSKCIILLQEGYTIEYCLSKFKKYKDILEDYLLTAGKLKNLQRVNPSNDYIKDTLNRILSIQVDEIESIAQSQNESEIKNPINNREKIRNLILKPAILFVIVFMTISLSFVGLAYGSISTVPNEALYPIKRTAEKIGLTLQPLLNKGSVHYQLLQSRLYEAHRLIDTDFSNNIDLIVSLLLEAQSEFDQCKKYNYFDNKSEEEVVTLINNAIDKYNNRLIEEFQKNNIKSNQNQGLEDSTEATSNDSDVEFGDSKSNQEQNLQNNTETTSKESVSFGDTDYDDQDDDEDDDDTAQDSDYDDQDDDEDDDDTAQDSDYDDDDDDDDDDDQDDDDDDDDDDQDDDDD